MRYSLAIILFFAVASLIAAEFTGRVTWIHDGDTVKIRSNGVNHLIRLWGIDAPEHDQDFGKESTKYLIKLIKNKTVIVKWDKQDRYGRIIGKIYLGKKYINLEIIKSGMAMVYLYYNNEKDFINAEKQAKKSKIGLWIQKNPMPPWKYRRKNKIAYSKK